MVTVVRNRSEFEAALAHAEQVILMVMGNGPGIDEIVKSADKAILLPEAQQAIWVQKVDIFTPEERAAYQPGDPDYVACSLCRPPRLVCARVSRSKALAVFFMEAVEAAENRTQPPSVLK